MFQSVRLFVILVKPQVKLSLKTSPNGNRIVRRDTFPWGKNDLNLLYETEFPEETLAYLVIFLYETKNMMQRAWFHIHLWLNSTTLVMANHYSDMILRWLASTIFLAFSTWSRRLKTKEFSEALSVELWENCSHFLVRILINYQLLMAEFEDMSFDVQDPTSIKPWNWRRSST